MNHLNPWEEKMQRCLSEHQVAPPHRGWERLQEELNAAESKPAAIQTAKDAGAKKRAPLWLRHTAISITTICAAACLTAVFVLHFGMRNQTEAVANGNDSIDSQLIATQEMPQAGTAVAKTTITNANVTETKTYASVQSDNQDKKKLRPRISSKVSDYEAEQAATSVHSLGSSFYEIANEEKQVAQSTAKSTDTHKNSATSLTSRAAIVPIHTTRRASSRKVQFSLSMNSEAARNFSNSGNYYQVPLLSASSPESADANIKDDMEQIVVGNSSEDVKSRVKHKATIRYGLGISIPLSRHWALHTGLTYSRLSTDIQSGTAEAYYRSEQRLHYIGIPLQVSYAFFTSRYVNLYAAAGGAIEKCVKGTLSTTVNNSPTMRSNESGGENLADGLWQISLGASMGVQLNLTKHIGIYAEPGFSYYIPDGSSLPNVRHDYPYRFDLQAGLRFSME